VDRSEYYFSVENLCKDLYLRSKMDEEGYVLISEIASFNRIRFLTGDVGMVRIGHSFVCHTKSSGVHPYRPSEDHVTVSTAFVLFYATWCWIVVAYRSRWRGHKILRASVCCAKGSSVMVPAGGAGRSELGEAGAADAVVDARAECQPERVQPRDPTGLQGPSGS
jgi:hypothetical protein